MNDPLRNCLNKNLPNYLSENPTCLNNQTCANNTNLVIVDSGTTGNYISTEAPLLNVKPTTTCPTVILLDNNTITATHEGMLDMPNLTSKARIANVFHTLGKSLLSVASIYDADGTATFTKKDATVHFDGKKHYKDP